MSEINVGGFCLLPVGAKNVKSVLGNLKSIQPFEIFEFGDWQCLRWQHQTSNRKSLHTSIARKTSGAALLFTNEPGQLWTLDVFHNGKLIGEFAHYYGMQEFTDPTDAHLYAVENFWEDHSLDCVAGIDRGTKLMEFLWDKTEERRLKGLNQAAKKERIVAKGFVSVFESAGISLPAETKSNLLKKTKPHQIIEGFFSWQKKAIVSALKQAGVAVKKNVLEQAFVFSKWDEESCERGFELTGSLFKVLDSIGALPAIEPLSFEATEDAGETAGAAESYWGDPRDHRTESAKSVYELTNKLAMAPIDRPLKVPLYQLDLLFQIPLISGMGEGALIGVELPGEEVIGEEDVADANLLRHQNLQYLQPIDGILRERDPVLEEPPSTSTKKQWVPLNNYLAQLPDGTKLDLRVGCEADQQATMRWTGIVKKGFFKIEMCKKGVRASDQKRALELFRKTNGQRSYEMKSKKQVEELKEIESWYRSYREYAQPKYDGRNVTWDSMGNFYATSAIFFVQLAGSSIDACPSQRKVQEKENKFWDDTEKLDQKLSAGHAEKRKSRVLVKRKGIDISELKSKAVTANSDFRKKLRTLTTELAELGFEHTGNMVCDLLGTGVVCCFGGPENGHAHILISHLFTPEFWTRFENDNVLVTNQGDNESQPRKGVFFRSYDPGLSILELYEKHVDGIEKVSKHRKTKPIIHQPDLDAFAEQLYFFLDKKMGMAK